MIVTYKVYKITNNINSKVYIGATTVSLRRRWLQHVNENKKNTIIKNAIKKYGKENFTIEAIEVLPTIDEMYEREIYWIAFYKSNKIGYNMLDGGNRGPVMIGVNHPKFGKPVSEKTLEMLRRKRGPMSDENKAKISAGNKGKPKPESFKIFASSHFKSLRLRGCYTKESLEKMKRAKTGVPLVKLQCSVICLNNHKVYNSQVEAAKALGVTAGNIPQVINGRYKHTKGFIFQKLSAEHLIF